MKRTFIVFLIILSFKAEAQSSALQLADSLYANGNYTKALQYKTYNNQAEVYDKIAKSYMAIGNYGAAADNYKKSVLENPENALVKYEYAKLLSRTKKYADASKIFNELMNIDSQNPNYHYELGLVLEKQKDTTAIKRFRSAYDLDNTHQKAIIKIAKYYLQKRKNDLVEMYVNKGLENYADNPALLNLKAQNYYWKEDYINAIIWFKKLLTLGESSEFIHEKLSLCYA